MINQIVCYFDFRNEFANSKHFNFSHKFVFKKGENANGFRNENYTKGGTKVAL